MTTITARTATTAGIRTNAAVVEIKVVEIKEEMKVEAEEDKCQQYALKGQKLLAQGNTLGIRKI